MLMLTELVLVQVYVRNCFKKHLCRFPVESITVLRQSNALFIIFNIYFSTNMCLTHLKGNDKKFSTGDCQKPY